VPADGALDGEECGDASGSPAPLASLWFSVGPTSRSEPEQITQLERRDVSSVRLRPGTGRPSRLSGAAIPGEHGPSRHRLILSSTSTWKRLLRDAAASARQAIRPRDLYRRAGARVVGASESLLSWMYWPTTPYESAARTLYSSLCPEHAAPHVHQAAVGAPIHLLARE